MKTYQYKLNNNQSKINQFLNSHNNKSSQLLEMLLQTSINRTVSFTIRDLKETYRRNGVEFDLDQSGQSLNNLRKHNIICNIIPNFDLPDQFQ